MKRFFVFLFFCFCLCPALIAQQDVRLTTYDGALVRSTNPLPVDASVTIGSITVSVFPVFADELGNPATATVDTDNRAWVNLASDTIGLIDAILAMSSTSTADISALQAAVASVTAEVAASGVNASETVLIAKLAELLAAAASETTIVTAIGAVETELSDAHADATGVATHTFAVMSYLSDNSNIVPWFTALVLGDGVNGNNQAAMANWLYDGVAWYRGRSLASSGVALAVEPAPTTIAQQTITLTPGVVSTITSLSGRRSISLKGYSINAETIWLSYDNVSTAAAVLSGDELAPGARISINLPEGLTVGMIASTAETVYVCEQGD